MLGKMRAFSALGLAALVMPPMVLAQLVILKTGLARPALLPRLWHRFMLKLFGFRVRVHGEMARGRPLLIVANHISWTDIMVAGSLGEVAFVAKSEVASWPAIGPLSKLSRTVFVERDRKARAGTQAGELAGRLSAREAMVLFAEGSTADDLRHIATAAPSITTANPARTTFSGRTVARRAPAKVPTMPRPQKSSA